MGLGMLRRYHKRKSKAQPEVNPTDGEAPAADETPQVETPAQPEVNPTDGEAPRKKRRRR